MATADRIDLASEVADIRDELVELQVRFERVMQDVRYLPGGDWLYQRIDAYPGVRFDLDMGVSKDADGWLAEVASSSRARTPPGSFPPTPPQAAGASPRPFFVRSRHWPSRR